MPEEDVETRAQAVLHGQLGYDSAPEHSGMGLPHLLASCAQKGPVTFIQSQGSSRSSCQGSGPKW